MIMCIVFKKLQHLQQMISFAVVHKCKNVPL
jgi:hypothetical protein